ncbi:hypothetical protein K7432_002258 [Basidiobolus ranarum]|uniref:Exonuclease domain-containing protein n=1 Tax=Basidiobolus ranarum TaxID=34480 RepID=A0ABR2W901_9FUNG
MMHFVKCIGTFPLSTMESSSTTNDAILTEDAITNQLTELAIDTEGQKKKTKKKSKKKPTTEVGEVAVTKAITPKKYFRPTDYYLCFDVEATCIAGVTFDFLNEIIEFPMILLDSNFQIVDIFHRYVRPVKQPILSEYCINLTGITQDIVDRSDPFDVVILDFERWMNHYSLFKAKKCLFITDGPYDIRDFIEKQYDHSHIIRPNYFSRPWIDLRKLFERFYKCDRRNLNGMLTQLDLVFEGREHSGIDDTKNIVRIVQRMHEDGCIFKPNCKLMTPPYKLRLQKNAEASKE